jgi:hypothetical protein
MKLVAACTLGLALLSVSPALAARTAHAHPKTFSLGASYQFDAGPLTTEQVWALDPEELNPHRALWALKREVGLRGLQVVQRGERFGVAVEELSAVTRSRVRGPGPWYSTMEQLGCWQAQPLPGFTTAAGARIASDAAAAYWDETLKRELVKLSVKLSALVAPSHEAAMAQASRIYRNWLKDVEVAWRTRAYQIARAAEWKFYDEGSPRCGKQFKLKLPRPVRERMEPVAKEPVKQLLARAPARRWNGLYSVRLSLTVGGSPKKLNGIFLIDTSAPRSVISPEFLQGQGIVPALVEVPNAPLERVRWSGKAGAKGATGLARWTLFEKVELAGYELPGRAFLLYDTEFYGPPTHVAPAFAGVIGNDILRKLTVELDPGLPAEVRLWAPAGFSLGDDRAIWQEASFVSSVSPEAWVSDCMLPEARSERSLVRWNTGDERALSAAFAPKAATTSFQCGGAVLAHDVPVARGSDGVGAASGASAPEWNATAGLGLLGKGPVVLDFPNGRVWFNAAFARAELPRNRSGVRVEFEFRKGERSLIVRALKPGSPAQALIDAGLKVGTEIEVLQALPAGDLDEWQIDQLLSGSLGEKTVAFEWGPETARKTAQLALP